MGFAVASLAFGQTYTIFMLRLLRVLAGKNSQAPFGMMLPETVNPCGPVLNAWRACTRSLFTNNRWSETSL